jgi:cation transport ATPase
MRASDQRPPVSAGMRLDTRTYGAAVVIFLGVVATGIAWFVAADILDIAQDGWARPLGLGHGAFAFAAVFIAGAIITVHARLGWRARRNRATGLATLVLAGLLIASGYGLYYGGEELRPAVRLAHLIGGFAAIGIVVLHVVVGRRSRS